MRFDSTILSVESSDTWDREVTESIPMGIYTAGVYPGSAVVIPDSASEVYIEVPRMTPLDSSIWTDPNVEATIAVEVNGVVIAGFSASGGHLLGKNENEGKYSGIRVPIPPGVNRQVKSNVLINGTAKTSCRVALKPSMPTPPLSTLSGLEWSGNQTTTLERRLQWTSPMAIYDATYIFKAFPKGPKTGPNQHYWTMFFWGNNGNFAWDGGFGNTYYGAHPYPFDGPSANTGQNWEIAVESNDFSFVAPNNGLEVSPWNTWYTQVFRARRLSATQTTHEFFWDWPDTGKVISHTVNDIGWADTNPPSPAIVVGQAPNFGGFSWGGYTGFEEYPGILRGFQFYNAFLTTGEIASEIGTPGSVRTPWYLNLNPTVADVTDKSGSGNHPSWGGPDRPADWAG